MANADQILSLIKSHLEGNDERFRTLALQISATEAKAGHVVLARSIKDLLRERNLRLLRPKLSMVKGDLADLLLEMDANSRLKDLVVSDEIRLKIKRIIKEYVQRDRLREYNLQNRHKILLFGPSGTGKTMTASVIAHELSMSLYVVRLEKIVTKFMGETSLKLSKVLDCSRDIPGVYLFDEFDAIGQKRSTEHEVGEMRRILNSFLQMMERDTYDSIILAATNDIEALDNALFRRFDDILEYTFPSEDGIKELIEGKLQKFHFEGNINALLSELKGKSQAEICMICQDAIKEVLLNDRSMDLQLMKEVIASRSYINKVG